MERDRSSSPVYRRYAIVNEADVAEGLGRLAGYLGRDTATIRR